VTPVIPRASRPPGEPGLPGRRQAGRTGERRGRAGAALLAAVLAVVLAAGLTACGAGRDAFGSGAGPCFMALPAARSATKGHGRLAGVALTDRARLTPRANRELFNLLMLLPRRAARDVCVVAFRGRFTPVQVRQATGPPPPGGAARFAIAVVRVPKPVLLGTFLVRRPPIAVNRSHASL
jgi:hypothetical protein